MLRTVALRALSACGVISLLAACTMDPIDVQSPDYTVGYNDGCASALSKEHRDKAMWDSSDGYRAGWRSGWDTCGNTGDQDAGSMFGGVFADPTE